MIAIVDSEPMTIKNRLGFERLIAASSEWRSWVRSEEN
jgi:hypothetical protein